MNSSALTSNIITRILSFMSGTLNTWNIFALRIFFPFACQLFFNCLSFSSFREIVQMNDRKKKFTRPFNFFTCFHFFICRINSLHHFFHYIFHKFQHSFPGVTHQSPIFPIFFKRSSPFAFYFDNIFWNFMRKIIVNSSS